MGIISINKLVTNEMNVVTGGTSTTGYNVDLRASDLQSIIGTRSVTPSARPPATGWSFDILISYENSKGETKTYEMSANNGEILSASIEDLHKIMVDAGAFYVKRCKLDAEISRNEDGTLPECWVH